MLAYVHSLVNMYTCTKTMIVPVVWKLSQIYELVTPYPLPIGYQGLIFSLCPFQDEYAYVCQMLSRSVQLCGIFPPFLYVRRNPLQIPPGAREVTCFSRCPFPDESAYVCQIWSRSVQLFATGPSVTANVSSLLSRCWR